MTVPVVDYPPPLGWVWQASAALQLKTVDLAGMEDAAASAAATTTTRLVHERDTLLELLAGANRPPSTTLNTTSG